MAFKPTPPYNLSTTTKWLDDTMKPVFSSPTSKGDCQPCHFVAAGTLPQEVDTVVAAGIVADTVAAGTVAVVGTVAAGTLLAEAAMGNKVAIARLQDLRRLDRIVHPPPCQPQYERPPTPPSPTAESWNPQFHQVEEDQPLTDDSEDA